MRAYYCGYGYVATKKEIEAGEYKFESIKTIEVFLIDDDVRTIKEFGSVELSFAMCKNEKDEFISFVTIADEFGNHSKINVFYNQEISISTCGKNRIKLLKPQAESQKSKERNNMLKLIYGMARHAYQYDPDATRNTATGGNKNSISATISEYGIDISDDTIRKFLKEAKSIID